MVTKVEDGKMPRIDIQVALPDNTTGIIPSSGVVNTYGSWLEISADIGDIDKYLNEIVVARSTSSFQVQVELGIGSGGSEVVIAGGHVRLISGVHETQRIDLGKVRVPKNSRLAVRVRDNNGTNNTYTTYTSLVSS